MQLFWNFRVMVKDPFHANCLPVHIGTLVELGKANGKALIRAHSCMMVKLFLLLKLFRIFSLAELFYLSHRLVDLYPNNPVSVMAISAHVFYCLHNSQYWKTK